MYLVLSPAKRLDFSPPPKGLSKTKPLFPDETATLIRRARKYSQQDLRRLMGISEDLAQLNHARFKAFDLEGKGEESKQAILSFAGDVYVGLKAETLDKEDLAFAQKHVGILSGLYGLLRPLDSIQPYRLEMGSRVNTKQGDTLYDFWQEAVTDKVGDMVKKSGNHKVLINLASEEYFSAIDSKAFGLHIVQPVFKEVKNGKASVMSFLAKKARGLMARYIIDNRIDEPEALKNFNVDRYKFDAASSTADRWIFSRPFKKAGT